MKRFLADLLCENEPPSLLVQDIDRFVVSRCKPHQPAGWKIERGTRTETTTEQLNKLFIYIYIYIHIYTYIHISVLGYSDTNPNTFFYDGKDRENTEKKSGWTIRTHRWLWFSLGPLGPSRWSCRHFHLRQSMGFGDMFRTIDVPFIGK